MFNKRITPIGYFALSSLFLLISLSLAVFKTHPDLWNVVLLFPLGFWMSFKGGIKGALAAFILAAAVLFLASLLHGAWGIFFVISIACSFFLVAQTSKEANHAYHLAQATCTSSEETIRQLNKQLKEAIAFAIQEKKEMEKKLTSYQDDLLSLKKEKEALDHKFQNQSKIQEHQKAFLENTLEEAKKEIQRQKDLLEHHPQEKEWLEELNRASASEFRLTLEIKGLEDDLAFEKLKNSAERLKLDSKLYMQLREQFEEKSEILHQTRKELFEVEGKLIALQKENQQNMFDFNPGELFLIQQLKEAEEQCQGLESEVETLQNLVSSLLAKKKTSQPKKRKVKEEEPVAADLELNFN